MPNFTTVAAPGQAEHRTTAPQTAESHITKLQVATRLNKSVRTVEHWMSRGILPYFKIGRSVSFRWSDVESHLDAKYRVGFQGGKRLRA